MVMLKMLNMLECFLNIESIIHEGKYMFGVHSYIVYVFGVNPLKVTKPGPMPHISQLCLVPILSGVGGFSRRATRISLKERI